MNAEEELQRVVQLLEAHLDHPVTDVVTALRVVLARRTRASSSTSSSPRRPTSDLVHPLRNKIAALKILLGRLDDCGPLNEAQRDVVGRCDDKARQMARLLESVSDGAAAESGPQTPKVTQFDVVAAVRSALDALRPWADGKNVKLVARSSVGVLPFSSDERLLRLLVTSLVEAAGDVTPGGTVVVHLGRSGDELYIFVIGEERRQGEAPRRGAGAEMAQHAVALLGGRIQCSADGRCFRVTVPPAPS